MTIRSKVACEIVAALALVSGSCMDLNERPASLQPDGGSLIDVDEWDVLVRIAGQGYTREGFVRVSSRPYPSDLTENNINVFVSVEGWWEFLHARPEVKGRGRKLPPGTIIVREVLDQDGAVETLTVMRRGPDGYSPAHGDIWYAVLEPDGFPRFEDGEPLIGRLEARCTGCHDERAADGHLFGVPLEARTPSLPVPTVGAARPRHGPQAGLSSSEEPCRSSNAPKGTSSGRSGCTPRRSWKHRPAAVRAR